MYFYIKEHKEAWKICQRGILNIKGAVILPRQLNSVICVTSYPLKLLFLLKCHILTNKPKLPSSMPYEKKHNQFVVHDYNNCPTIRNTISHAKNLSLFLDIIVAIVFLDHLKVVVKSIIVILLKCLNIEF